MTVFKLGPSAAPAADPPQTHSRVEWTCARCGTREAVTVPDFAVQETIAALRKSFDRHWGEEHSGEERT